jgi:hypothetical protein
MHMPHDRVQIEGAAYHIATAASARRDYIGEQGRIVCECPEAALRLWLRDLPNLVPVYLVAMDDGTTLHVEAGALRKPDRGTMVI